jgi:hypothetical protein
MQLLENEKILRKHLGIPADAQRVLIFAESSHWDPNWMLTSEEYFNRYVRENLDIAIEELLREPRRVYSIECMFFLRMYWNRSPEQHSKIRALVNDGRLRLTSSGVTTADTLIPSMEAILRDFLIGQEWLRDRGMVQEPNLAYFTDSFGGSPALPSILKAAGFDRTTITRIDGMSFPGSGFQKPNKIPNVITSADRLLKTERTLDFIWRDRHGAEVLCHWNAFTYGQGDMLASRGLIRLYRFPTSFSDRSKCNVTRRIHKYEKQLKPYAKTPYLFCPIGFDFVKPIPDIVFLLDRYNHSQYPKTGLWVVNAGLDDYLTLVDFHRADLPVIEMDPNPYWTGFYSSRPTLKQRSYDLVDNLVMAEQLSLRSDDDMKIQHVSKELQEPWWYAVITNHHDFITGTSPDRIVEEEQIPWLQDALLQTEDILQDLSPNASPNEPQIKSLDPPSFTTQNERIHIRSKDYSMDLSGKQGGTIVQAQPNASQHPVLQALSNDVVSYRDSGGLWRMGFEFGGGTWKIEDQSSRHPVRLDVQEKNGVLEITNLLEIQDQTIHQQIWCKYGDPLIRFRVMGRAASRHTYTVRFMLNLKPSQLVMDTPGGVVIRPPRKIYDPTFWPFYQFLHLVDDVSGEGIAFFQRYPGAISYNPDGSLELVALRNAIREKAYHFLFLPGNPARGSEKEDYAFEYALLFTSQGDWKANRLPEIANSIRRSPVDQPVSQDHWETAASIFSIDRQDVKVIAAKAATLGEGWILRLYSPSAVGEPLRLSCKKRKVLQAHLCDARERDIEQLSVQEGTIHLMMPGTIATLRLMF